jgi:osmotically-inducible protein OsmY
MLPRSDQDIERDITAEFKWEPSLQSDDIAVAARDGVVTLAGYADSYYDMWKAERVASRVKGVKAIANDIEVRLPSGSVRPDPQVAAAAVDALRWNVLVPHDQIKVKVQNGWVTLEGEVKWHYQAKESERSVRRLTGVRGVTSLVTIRKQPVPSDVKQRIRRALERGAEFDADRITVDVDGNNLILRGTVRSYVEKRDAESAARNAPGVTVVDNRLTVDPLMPATV